MKNSTVIIHWNNERKPIKKFKNISSYETENSKFISKCKDLQSKAIEEKNFVLYLHYELLIIASNYLFSNEELKSDDIDISVIEDNTINIAMAVLEKAKKIASIELNNSEYYVNSVIAWNDEYVIVKKQSWISFYSPSSACALNALDSYKKVWNNIWKIYEASDFFTSSKEKSNIINFRENEISWAWYCYLCSENMFWWEKAYFIPDAFLR